MEKIKQAFKEKISEAIEILKQETDLNSFAIEKSKLTGSLIKLSTHYQTSIKNYPIRLIKEELGKLLDEYKKETDKLESKF